MFEPSADLVIPNLTAAIVNRAEVTVTKMTKTQEVSKEQVVVQWLRDTVLTVV